MESAAMTPRVAALRSVEELLSEVARIEAAAREEVRAGVTPGATVGTRIRVGGGWSLGQVFQHLARAVERSFEASAPGRAGGRWDHDAPELMPDAQVWTDAGADMLRRALARIGRGERMLRGGMSHDEWMAAHLRHAELHLGLIHMSV